MTAVMDSVTRAKARHPAYQWSVVLGLGEDGDVPPTNVLPMAHRLTMRSALHQAGLTTSHPVEVSEERVTLGEVARGVRAIQEQMGAYQLKELAEAQHRSVTERLTKVEQALVWRDRLLIGAVTTGAVGLISTLVTKGK